MLRLSAKEDEPDRIIFVFGESGIVVQQLLGQFWFEKPPYHKPRLHQLLKIIRKRTMIVLNFKFLAVLFCELWLVPAVAAHDELREATPKVTSQVLDLLRRHSSLLLSIDKQIPSWMRYRESECTPISQYSKCLFNRRLNILNLIQHHIRVDNVDA